MTEGEIDVDELIQREGQWKERWAAQQLEQHAAELSGLEKGGGVWKEHSAAQQQQQQQQPAALSELEDENLRHLTLFDESNPRYGKKNRALPKPKRFRGISGMSVRIGRQHTEGTCDFTDMSVFSSMGFDQEVQKPNRLRGISGQHTARPRNMKFDEVRKPNMFRGISGRLTANSTSNGLINCNSPDSTSESSHLAHELGALSCLPMLQHLDDEELQAILDKLKKVEYGVGQSVFRQGEDTSRDDYSHLYIVSEGELGILVDGKRLPYPCGTLTKGAIFGDEETLTGQPRGHTIVVESKDAVLQRISRNQLKPYLATSIHVHSCSDVHEVFKESTKSKTLSEEQAAALDATKEQIRQVDTVLREIWGLDTRYKGDVMLKPKSSRWWLYTRWSHTVLYYTWKTVLLNMAFTGAIALGVSLASSSGFGLGMKPYNEENEVTIQMKMVGFSFTILSTLATFILTFFLSESYSFWRDVYWNLRGVQGRYNDICLLLSLNAARDGPTFTPEATKVMDDVGHYIRLCNIFTWATTCRKYRVLNSQVGMERMVKYGCLYYNEYKTLQLLGVENPVHACTQWIGKRALQGMESGAIQDDVAVRQELFSYLSRFRATFATIEDLLDGSMHMAYAHLVQLLVDVLLISAPFTFYPNQGLWSILTVGLYTMFFAGLLDLSKMFLDPFDNEGLHKKSVNLDLGVLIREVNSGSAKYKLSGLYMPFD